MASRLERWLTWWWKLWGNRKEGTRGGLEDLGRQEGCTEQATTLGKSVCDCREPWWQVLFCEREETILGSLTPSKYTSDQQAAAAIDKHFQNKQTEEGWIRRLGHKTPFHRFYWSEFFLSYLKKNWGGGECGPFLKSLLNLLQYCLFLFMSWFLRGMWDLSSPTRDRTLTPGTGKCSKTHWTGRSPYWSRFQGPLLLVLQTWDQCAEWAAISSNLPCPHICGRFEDPEIAGHRLWVWVLF